MKRILKFRMFMVILLLTAAISSALANDRLYIEEFRIMPGETGMIEFSLENTQDMFGFQVDIDLPERMEFIQIGGNPDIKMSSRADGCDCEIVSHIISPWQIRIGVFSTSHSPYAGNDGVLFSVGVKASESCAGGTITATNIRFIDREDKDIILPNCSAEVNVVIPATSIKLSSTEWSCKVGEGILLTATVLPENATDKNVTWSSSNEAVATVDPNGNVTAVGLGSADIIAACGEVSATCAVTIVPTPVESITLSNTSLNLTEGETATLTATVEPTDATDKKVTWTSSEASIATVSTEGVVTAVKAGTATITATSANGKTATCTVTVAANIISVESIAISKTELSLTEGDTAALSATIAPENATDMSMTWTSSDASVATVSAEGVVTAVKAGTATITVASSNGKTATCTVTVAAKVIDVSAITLSNNELNMIEGDTATIIATITPENATDKSVNWTSSDVSIATVSADGDVTAVKAGRATITAASSNGKTATCLVTVAAKVIEVIGITLSNTELKLTEGDTATLTATIAPENATDKNVTWTSSDASIATVSADGKVTAVKAGIATITAASSNGKTATCLVTVAANIISVESILISNTEISLTEGESATLTATIAPENATDKSVNWTSSDASIATVSADGNVTAVKAGIATITAASSNGKTATCVVTVAAKVIEVIGITLSNTELKLTEGDTATLTATIAPDNATDKNVTWTSSDASIATVSADGKVTAVKTGTATITAASSNGKTATCLVTVAANIISVESIAISKTELSMTEGDTATLTVTIIPENATDKSVTWTSSDTSIATVSDEGVVTAVKSGTATITAASSNGKIATCTVTVAAKVIEVTGITLSNTELSLTNGETANLRATISPENATDKTVKWTSSDESVATVSSNGKVTAVGIGYTVITVSATDGSGVKAECKVTVSAGLIPVTSITLSATEWEGTEGDQFTLKATVLPEDATNKAISWSSSNESVATVSSDGIVTAVGAGYAIISALASDGSGINASAFVKVSSSVPQVYAVTYNFGEPATLTPAQNVEPSNDPACEVDGVIFRNNNIALVASGGNTSPRLWSNSSKGVQLRVYNGGKITVYTEKGLSEISSIEIVGQQLDALTIDGETFSNQTEITYTLKTPANSLTIDCVTHGSHKRADISYITVKCQTESGSVDDIKVQELYFSEDEIKLKVGDEYHVQATILPANATNKLLEWNSNAPDIVSVGNDGRLLARKPGVAKISAKTLDGTNLMSSLEVTVLPILVETLTINPTVWSGEEGSEFTIIATVLPEDANDKTVSFFSSDTSIAIVDAVGNVKVLKEGTCIITVSTVDGSNLTAECVVTGLSGVEAIFADPEACVDVYDMNGIMLKHHCSRDDLNRLKPAVYILRRGKTVVKAVVK